jgi:hypothetical protein
MAKGRPMTRTQKGIECQARQPAMSPVHTTAATLMARPVSATAEPSIVAAISRAVRATRARPGAAGRAPRMPMANSLKITKQADTSLATAAVITPSRPGGRIWIT